MRNRTFDHVRIMLAGMAAPAGPVSRPHHLAVIRLLILSSHPLPTIAVTAFAAGLCALSGLAVGTAALVVAAVFAGQLTIGWSNDAIDAERDEVNSRTDKPVAGGAISRTVVGVSAFIAGLLTLVLSVLLGWPAGIPPMVIVISGLVYNLGAKASIWSWLPYAVAFGLLPAAATVALPAHPWPSWWAGAAGALLGVAAHFANVLPDLIADERTGVHGLPHRLGSVTSAIAGPALLLLATWVILFGSADQADLWRIFVAGVFALIAVFGAIVGIRSPGRRELFIAMVGLAGAVIVLFAVSGASLIG